ncbi:MAG: 2-isopropylmalate synthase [Acutalibacteraceae bacterium]|jgi:2-isopropylmalate synthase
MSKTIKIFDTSLRDGEQSPGCSMNLHEKLKLAKQLEKLKVDIIEAGFAISSPGDFESVSAVAKLIKDCKVASLARAREADIDAAYNAVKDAVSPRIHVFLATSPVHMKYKLEMTPDEVYESAVAAVKYAKKFCSDIEFSAEDATRSEPEFLLKVMQGVIDAGATVINIPDTVGYSVPDEMFERIDYLMKNIKGIEKVDVSVHCHNDLGMAVANSLAAVKAGATQVECTVNGIGERAGNASLEEIVMALHTRKAFFDAVFNVDTTQIYRTSKLLSDIIGISVAPNKAIVGANAFAHEAGIHQHGVLAERSTYEIMKPEDIGLLKNKMVLGKHSGKHALADRLKELGYNLTKEELEQVFVQFKELADKKKTVSDDDIEALASSKNIDFEQSINLVNFTVNTGQDITSTANITIKKRDTMLSASSDGDGPIDALFKAINKALGQNYELLDYTIRSVGEGEDALGEVIVKVAGKDKNVIGKGLSTDIIKSSILAYLTAISKITD